MTWWRHQMETFFALLALCAGNSLDTGEFPSQRPVARSFDVFFDQRLNKRLSKQLWGWWFEMPLRSLWCHRNEMNTHLEEEGWCGVGVSVVTGIGALIHATHFSTCIVKHPPPKEELFPVFQIKRKCLITTYTIPQAWTCKFAIWMNDWIQICMDGL